MTTKTRETIVQLLSAMTGTKEVRTYLQRFSALEAERFAVIKIGGALIDEALEETAEALAFLHQVGLTPVVVHGGGPQLDKALAERNITTEKLDGLRVTPPEVLDIAREVFTEQNIKLVEAIRARGVECDGLATGAVNGEFKDKERLGFVGEATGINQPLIRSVISAGAIPILSCLGIAPGGQLVNINGDAVVAALVHALQPLKIIFLTGTGGLLDENGDLIDSINLTSDYDDLMAQSWVHSGMRLKVQSIKELLDDLPPESSISITSPKELVRELFTHGGSGTFFRKGERIRNFTSKGDVDVPKLHTLVEGAFGRKLDPDWWESLNVQRVIVSETYRTAAVVTQVDGLEVPYLDKFAVSEVARGEGLAKALWKSLQQTTPAFFLRSRAENAFNEFYHSHCTGAVKYGRWTVFWSGDVDLATIAAQVESVAALPESFQP